MTCPVCAPIDASTDLSLPHVVRACEHCGDDYRVRDPGRHGIGLSVRKGDRFVFPPEFLKVSANPLKGSSNLTAHGLAWFAQLVFGTDLATQQNRDDVVGALEKIRVDNEKLFEGAEFLSDLDLNDPTNETEVQARLSAREKSVEWWGYLAAGFAHTASEAVKAGNASEAAWSAACAERFRALAVFKQNFEEVVFMGHSVGRLVELFRIWDANKDNGEEGYWQTILGKHSYAFSQLFSVPVTFIEGTAYVGGTQLDGKDARYLDFMLSGGSANHAILVEIKTPKSALLGARYRKNVFPPSKELGGAVVQINDYCDVLRKNVERITRERKIELNTFNPRRVILMGNYEDQLSDPKRRASFELFRASLAGVEIVTFDEFFKKLEHLAKLFNLTRSPPAPPRPSPPL